MRLTDREKGFLSLILRSPDQGDGWRNVSAVVWPLVAEFKRQELIEIQYCGDDRHVRLTPEGNTVAKYLV
jgi:hypothetical protein